MTVVPFSQLLRERSRSGHGESEHSGFMADLMKGEGTREDYVALVAQHWFLYEALEQAAQSFAGDPVAEPFLSPQLTRLPALESDLEFLIGPEWRATIAPMPTTQRYVARIREVEAQRWAGGFVAHHYTRYLGDLSGGQAIGRLMSRYFGFETNGVLFYLFEQIANPRDFKELYRAELDAAPWGEEEKERVIDEVLRAYRFNTELFEDLARAKQAA
ncbi:MAG: biliverdin-producing heme oxygenase [Actinomycetales bacterium]|nr:biliverdin-producing heme oxygenase [Actinomycetales bacterium]